MLVTTSMVAAVASAPVPSPGLGAAQPGRPAVDLRPNISSDLVQQGARPLCLALCLSFAHEAVTENRRPPAGRGAMAPEAIWWHCSSRGRTFPGGMLLEDGAVALGDVGQPRLSDWPWNPALGVGTENPPTAVGSPPWHRAEVEEIDLAHDGIEGGIEDALAAGHPVILIVELSTEFDDAAPDGSIDVPDIRSPMGDYHAVLVVGARTHHQSGRRLLIRNSWGTGWGANGYGWLPLDYLVAHAGQAAVVLANPQAEAVP